MTQAGPIRTKEINFRIFKIAIWERDAPILWPVNWDYVSHFEDKTNPEVEWSSELSPVSSHA